jgi:hypothetical protein
MEANCTSQGVGLSSLSQKFIRVEIRKVDNGYIVNNYNQNFIANTLAEALELTRKSFE